MKLKAFRIRNFRSIIDTKWNKFSNDNITCLIGQNESGKTSVIEGIMCFSDGVISEDMLRSDLSLPEISCRFIFEDNELDQTAVLHTIHPVVQEIIKKNNSIGLKRKWVSQKSSHLLLDDEDIDGFFSSYTNEKETMEKEAYEHAGEITKMAARLNEEVNKVNEELSSLKVELFEAREELQKLQDGNQLKSLNSEEEMNRAVERLKAKMNAVEVKIEKKTDSIKSRKSRLAEMADKIVYGSELFEAKNSYKRAAEKLEEAQIELDQIEHLKNNSQRAKELKGLNLKLNQANQDLIHYAESCEKCLNEYTYKYISFYALCADKNIDEAELFASTYIENEKKLGNSTDLAELFFPFIPIFQYFEDFSSLLPNKIDIDDIINENSSVEGYRAARSFLISAGIDPEFFMGEHSSRILKQKIENLNGEITLNFQDYWRQYVGENNKITINFDLEHYGLNHHDKKGEPFLEFWIKDRRERLYPKQRSRGVRWFLSFYLELQATARLKSNRSRLLLIDEPGVSLHARAQEDVLKVFEDIKDKIQIIYTTHSPHLVDSNKLYRLLAVQRANDADDRSQTLVYSAKEISKASADTLSPIFTLMGTRINDQKFVQQKNNLIVDETSSFYYITTLMKMLNYKDELYVLPATGVQNIPVLVNMLLGWKLEFAVLLTGNDVSQNIYNTLKETVFFENGKNAESKILHLKEFPQIEDIFSTIDFKRFVLHERIGITESNSEFIKLNNYSRTKLASGFMLHVLHEKIKIDDFDEETRHNIQMLFGNIGEILN